MAYGGIEWLPLGKMKKVISFSERNHRSKHTAIKHLIEVRQNICLKFTRVTKYIV